MPLQQNISQPGGTAKTLHESQRHYDRLHHQKRLHDLDGDWGKSIPTHEAEGLRQGSKACLEVIDNSGMATNSVDLTQSEYLAELDQFASHATGAAN